MNPRLSSTLIAASISLALISTAMHSTDTHAAGINAPIATQGSIKYQVFATKNRIMVGVAEHRWQLNSTSYEISADMKSTGLAALFKPMFIRFVSKGGFDKDGLTPQTFEVYREADRRLAERAEFDYSAQQLLITHDNGERKTYPMAGNNAQDVLSLTYALAWPNAKASRMIQVTTGKKAEAYVFLSNGSEKIEIDGNKIIALHLSSQSTENGEQTDVWLVPAWKNAAIKIRQVTSRGEVAEQIATQITLDGKRVWPLPD